MLTIYTLLWCSTFVRDCTSPCGEIPWNNEVNDTDTSPYIRNNGESPVNHLIITSKFIKYQLLPVFSSSISKSTISLPACLLLHELIEIALAVDHHLEFSHEVVNCSSFSSNATRVFSVDVKMASRLSFYIPCVQLQTISVQRKSRDIILYKAEPDPKSALRSHHQDEPAAVAFSARHPQSEGAYLTPFR